MTAVMNGMTDFQDRLSRLTVMMVAGNTEDAAGLPRER